GRILRRAGAARALARPTDRAGTVLLREHPRLVTPSPPAPGAPRPRPLGQSGAPAAATVGRSRRARALPALRRPRDHADRLRAGRGARAPGHLIRGTGRHPLLDAGDRRSIRPGTGALHPALLRLLLCGAALPCGALPEQVHVGRRARRRAAGGDRGRAPGACRRRHGNGSTTAHTWWRSALAELRPARPRALLAPRFRVRSRVVSAGPRAGGLARGTRVRRRAGGATGPVATSRPCGDRRTRRQLAARGGPCPPALRRGDDPPPGSRGERRHAAPPGRPGTPGRRGRGLFFFKQKTAYDLET